MVVITYKKKVTSREMERSGNDRIMPPMVRPFWMGKWGSHTECIGTGRDLQIKYNL